MTGTEGNRESNGVKSPRKASRGLTTEQIIAALTEADGNRTDAARILGCARKTIWERSKKDSAIYAACGNDGRSSVGNRRILSLKRRGENHWNWKGGSSWGKYCPKFNYDFKERVREFFGRRCVECGTPENGERLCIHHVNFRKDACCAEDVVPLFVPLCKSCHAKTNYNRPHWEAKYTALIREKHDGLCYLPKPGDPVTVSNPRGRYKPEGLEPTFCQMPSATLSGWGIA